MSKKVSNDLYCIDFIMKNCFTEWAKKQEPCLIYKLAIFKIAKTTGIKTTFHSFHNI